MFIAGAIAGVVVVGVASHDDYSDHRNYSKYGDAYLIAEIKAKEAEIEKHKRDIELIQRSIDEKYKNTLEIIKSEELLNEAYNRLPVGSQRLLANSPLQFKQKLINDITDKIEKSLDEDKKRLNEIDAVIMKINKLQLSKKSGDKENVAVITSAIENDLSLNSKDEKEL